MNETLKRIKTRGSEALGRLSTGKKIAFGSMILLLVASIIVIALMATKPEYELLFSDLENDAATKVVDYLEQQKIPHVIKNRSVYVPPKEVDKLRLKLSELEVTGRVDGDQGFDPMLPQEVIALNMRRSQEAELGRSIASMDEVRSARVHLALPKESLFVEDQAPVTASVVLYLEPGAVLSKRSVKSVVSLVAGAVPGLSPDHVSVVDQHGKALHDPDGDMAEIGSHLEYRANLEKTLEEKAVRVVEAMVGTGKVRVEVAAEVDFTREQRTETLVDPERRAAVTENNSTEERENGDSRVGGPAGAQANVAQGTIRVGDASRSNREESRVEYENSKILRKIEEAGGKVLRLSVAVVVDGTYPESAKGEPEFVPRSQAELTNIQDHVAAAIGFSPDRKDQIKVISAPFEKSAEVDPVEVASAAERRRLIEKGAQYGLLLLVALLLLFLVFRPVVRYLTSTPDDAEVLGAAELPKSEEPLALPGHEAIAALEKEELDLLSQVRNFARKNPDLASSVVRAWLKEAD